MRSSIALLMNCALVSLVPLAITAQNTNAVVNVLSDTNAVHNFKVALSFPKTTFTNGEPVICLAGLTNVSDSPTIVGTSSWLVNLKFLVTNETGAQIPPLHSDYSMGGGHIGPELVPPHGVERGFRPFPLNDYFKLTPGSYRISVVREMGYPFNNIMYTSQVVTIKILESPIPNMTNAPASKPK